MRKKMRIFLPLLCVLCATPVHSIFDGTCPRKDPPPGVLVLSTGSKLVLTCRGHVQVDGVKVSMARNSLNTNRRGNFSDATPTTANIISNTGVSMKSDKHTMENTVSEVYHSNPTEAGENRSLGHTDIGYTASSTTHMVQPTSVSRLLNGESNWEAEEMDGEGDYEEEGEEGSRVTRGIKSRPRWKWNRRTVGKGDRDWGEITFERREATLSLSSVRLTDSGKYTCYNRGRATFSLKIIVTDPPETPRLSCYKKSPSSKIRCEWVLQEPVTIMPNCYLFLSKSPTEPFLHLPCSYSSEKSRCWCALDHNDDELRILHMAYLCVTSIVGNATSTLLHFIPLNIVKPDPPSYVSVRQEEGQEMWMTVTWHSPTSWKSQLSYYGLIYEIRYKPLRSSFYQEQMIKGQRSYIIKDALPGVEYLIQLRAKDEYDGQWSDWSTPVNASSWTAQGSVELSTTMFPEYVDHEGSGTDDHVPDVSTVSPSTAVPDPPWHPILWICGSFAFLSVILAAYIFRHKDRCISKLQSLSVVTQCGDSPQPSPSAPIALEGQALVTFAPSHYKETPPSEVEEGEEENDEEQQVKDRIEAVHFNNTSYFFLQRE